MCHDMNSLSFCFLSISYPYEFIHCYSNYEAVTADTEDNAAAEESKETPEV